MGSRTFRLIGMTPLAALLAVPVAAQQTIPVMPPRKQNTRPQRSPSRERYKQIQTALRDHGYSPGPIDGQWGSKSAAALRRFERDHDLRADGKLDARVLIALGLGPNHPEAAASTTESGD